ncbi:hypothetical protein MRX96_007052 [Rhipicephalus microplus]
MAVPAEPTTFAVTFGCMNVADNNHRRGVEVAFDVPDEQYSSSVGGEETVAVMQPAVGICVRRVAQAIVIAGTRNKWVHFPRTAEEKAAVKEEVLRFELLRHDRMR